MKYIQYITLYLSAFLFTHAMPSHIHAQAVIEDPIVTIQSDWANHKIESYHFTAHGTFAFIDDGSLWRINPDETEWITEEKDSLLEIPITIMPEAGTENFPVRIIVHNKSTGWKDFTVAIESSPTQPDRALIADIDTQTESLPTITIQKRTRNGLIEATLYINPADCGTIQNWSIGQRIVIGGVWFPEYDPVGRQEYDCTFMYIIHNYDTNEFAFFTF